MKASVRKAEMALKSLKSSIELQREVLDADVAFRDACILTLLRNGYSEREVAELAGISAVRVHQIKEEATV